MESDVLHCKTVGAMLDGMGEFVQGELDPLSIRCLPLEDIRRGKIGFVITKRRERRERKFWVRLSNSGLKYWGDVLRTPQGRDWVASGGSNLWRLLSPKTDYRWTEDLVKC
jgi:hypothetical protein